LLGLDYRGVRLLQRLLKSFRRYVPSSLYPSLNSCLSLSPVTRWEYGWWKEADNQVAFKTFLNITPNLSFPPPPATTPNAAPQEFILTFEENPLAEFAELPPDAREGGLWFSNVLCGVVRGALEMVSPNPFLFLLLAFLEWIEEGSLTTRSNYRLRRDSCRMCYVVMKLPRCMLG
jgi:hypothetical protein